ncbi:MAG: NB-ARC domain-containing protein [Caldilineaceae bacterium]
MALQQWHQPDAAGSALADLYLVQTVLQNGAPGLRRATNDVLLAALRQMESSYQQDADILRQRFADLLSAQVVANKHNVVEGALYKKQRAAIERLGEVLHNMEFAARTGRSAELMARLETPTYQQLFGVNAHLDCLAEKLLTPEPPWLISVEGMGGIGKTALVHALCSQMIEQGLVGWGALEEVGWVTARQTIFNGGGALKNVTRPALTVEALVDGLLGQLLPGAGGAGRSADERLQQLQRRLQERPHLIVIDNLETVTDVHSLLSTLHMLANPTKFLLTTRHSLFGELDVFHYGIPELNEDDALTLVRTEAAQRNLPLLAQADDADLHRIYETVAAIRWRCDWWWGRRWCIRCTPCWTT